MRRFVIAATLLASFTVAGPAFAQSNSTLSGAAIGAGSGAIIAGPIGAVAGGVIGAVVGGPTFHRGGRSCWRDSRGIRHCRWR
jgi:osmotically inducible lipoprotein OsmB